MTGIDARLVVLIVPLVLLELGLTIWALWDLTRPGRRVRGESRLMWGAIVLFVSGLGPILYFVVGRQDATSEPEPRPAWPTAEPAAPIPPTPVSPAPVSPTGAPPTSAAPPAAWAGSGVGSPATAAASPGALAIACRGLSKRYPGGILALDGLDLDVPTGSVFGLLGPNGAGKTTTLRILVGLAHPTGGSATVAGVALGDPRLTDRIGFLDQDPRYYGWSTGRELVELVGRLHGLAGPALATRVAEVLAQVGLADAADRRIGTYSGGMRQRLGIAQALVDRPPVLILDEPVSSLDPEGRRDLLALIAELADHGHRPVLDPRPRRRRAGMRPDRDPRPRSTRHRGPAGRDPRPLRPADLPGRSRAGSGRGDRPARRHAPGDRLGHRRSTSTTARSGSPSNDPRPCQPGAPAGRSSPPSWPWPASSASDRRSRTSSCG